MTNDEIEHLNPKTGHQKSEVRTRSFLLFICGPASKLESITAAGL